jgi:hypothetical protein
MEDLAETGIWHVCDVLIGGTRRAKKRSHFREWLTDQREADLGPELLARVEQVWDALLK